MPKKDEPKPKSKWVIQSFMITFCLSLLMSFVTTNGMANLNVFLGIIILILVILLGIITDIIGVAVTVADESEFHAKASKKIKGSKTSIKLIKNASIVANLFASLLSGGFIFQLASLIIVSFKTK